MTKIEGIKYEVKVCESITDFAHGIFIKIEEIYVPPIISFNEKGKIFLMSEERAKERYRDAKELERITLDSDDISILLEYIEKKKEAIEVVRKYLEIEESLIDECSRINKMMSSIGKYFKKDKTS